MELHPIPPPGTLNAVEAHGRALRVGSCSRCCRPLWRRLHLRLEETRLQIDEERVQLTPAFDASAAQADELRDPHWFWPWPQPAPPGPAVRLKSPEQEWLLCATSERQRDGWLCALQDAVALSHGPGTPAHDWSFGARLGEGSFGAVRAATHRRDGRRAAVKVVAGTHGEATRAAVLREIALMRRLRAELPPGAAECVLTLLDDYGVHDARSNPGLAGGAAALRPARCLPGLVTVVVCRRSSLGHTSGGRLPRRPDARARATVQRRPAAAGGGARRDGRGAGGAAP